MDITSADPWSRRCISVCFSSSVGAFGIVILLLSSWACTGGGLLSSSACTGGAPACTGGSTGNGNQSDPAHAAQFIYPRNQSSTIDPFTKFQWSSLPSSLGYYLEVGTSQGGADVFAVGELPPNVTSWAVDNLLPGQTYYARLITNASGVFNYVDISFQARVTAPPNSTVSLHETVESLTSSVRLSAAPFSNLATPGTPLASELALRGRTQADCTDYSYTLIDLLQQQHIYAHPVVLALVGNFWVGHTLVEYYDPFLKKWSVADPTFGVIYYDDATQTGQSAAELSSYIFAESFSLIHPKLVTPNGDSYLRNYYLDPVTLFLNIVPSGSTPQQNVVHDPLQYLIPVADPGVQGLYLFCFGNASDAIQINNPDTGPYVPGQISMTPQENTLWAWVVGLNPGWTFTGSSDVQVYTPRRVFF